MTRRRDRWATIDNADQRDADGCNAVIRFVGPFTDARELARLLGPAGGYEQAWSEEEYEQHVRRRPS